MLKTKSLENDNNQNKIYFTALRQDRFNIGLQRK